jgi:hypothetical protein
MWTKNKYRILAWLFFGLITTSVIGAVIFDVSTHPAEDPYLLLEILIAFVPLSLAFVGALIISRQPRRVNIEKKPAFRRGNLSTISQSTIGD